MAGSYKHIINRWGEFTGTDLIDNLGDAYEALEECFDIIQYLSGGDRAKIHEAWLNGHIKKRNPTMPTQENIHGFDAYWRVDDDDGK